MRRRFPVTCALVVGLGVWGWCAQAQQQSGSGSASQSTSQSSSTQSGTKGTSSGNSAQDSTPNDIPTPDDPAPDAKNDQSVPVGGEVKNPTTGGRVKKHVKDQMSSWCVGFPVDHCFEKKSKPEDQNTQNKPPRSDDPTPTGESASVTPPPMRQGESSSKDTKIDLTPPVGDANDHPGSSPDPEAGPTEFHAWDPHRAMKNVEVGDYYYKRGNYRAAISRYEEALQWKPKDAEATFKLADAYDKVGDFIDAKDNYQKYLKILPEGPRAQEATKALARMESKVN